MTGTYVQPILFAVSLIAVGAASVQGRERPVSAESEEARLQAAEHLYQRKLYPKAADAYRRLLASENERHRQQAMGRLYVIANYWLGESWERVRTRQHFKRPEWLVWVYPCDVFPEILPEPETLFQHALSCRDLLHWDDSKPFFNQEGRAIELLRCVHDSDAGGSLAGKALFLMGYLAWFHEDYQRADECFSRIEKKHPSFIYYSDAVELAIKAKLMSLAGTEEDKQRLAEARRLIYKAQKLQELSEEKKESLLKCLVSVSAHEAHIALQDAEKCQLAGQTEQARSRYQRICEDFPGTYTAVEAKQRLTRMAEK